MVKINYYLNSVCYLIASLLLSFFACAQELPPIKNYKPIDYGSENQNWAISQDENKFIYVANNKGLLEFNGAEWRLYPSPNETIFRSVKVVNDKIFTGFYMDFGFWIKSKYGKLEYTSIVKETNLKMLEDEQIWTILEIDGWILFKSLERIYLYNLATNQIKIINAQNRITKLSKVDGLIYFQEINKGIFKIENGVPKLVSENAILKNNKLVQIFKHDNKLLFLTEENGFYFLNKHEVEKWEIPANEEISTAKLYSAKKLNNEDFILGTVSKGIISINKYGILNYTISQSSGLNNNTVLSIFEDAERNLWLGLDNGISCINNTSPFKFYQKKTDFLGTVYCAVHFEDTLYLGTNQGLFYKKLQSNDSFQIVENTKGQVWSLVVIDETLFCGHDSGTFIIRNNNAKKVFTTQGTWDIKKYSKNIIIQGSYDGLYILEKWNDGWRFKNKLKGFDNSSRYFVIENPNTIFVNHEYKGVYKLKVNDSLNEVIEVVQEKSIQKGIHSSLINYKDEILFSSKLGVFAYKKNTDAFIKDTIISQLISRNNFTSGKLIYNATNDRLWAFSDKNLKYLTPGKLSSIPVIKTIPILELHRKGASGYENIIQVAENKQLIGTSNGFVTLDLDQLKEIKDFTISINRIHHFELNKPQINASLKETVSFQNKLNNVQLFFSVPNYNKIVGTNYQYKLNGLSSKWSKLSKVNSALFENLSYGDYTFMVRASVGGKMSQNIAQYTFSIQKPWYLSTISIIIYLLLLILLVYFSHINSKRYYKKQKQILLEKTKKEAVLLELKSSKKIIKLNNDKLRSDIESKNKELASSTMNLIKKNQFLNIIKKELKVGDEKSIHKVIKIIDKNLNDTDDWKMFQEAFNNADKKFLKKVKTKHPQLTPNDLRLCAYLRLNLSSKEIAPLLNISPRSVEVKRYRLRKKLDLDHDANLTNYILEV